MFEDYKFLFEHSYETRWDFLFNTDDAILSYYEDMNKFYVSNEKESFNCEFYSFLNALRFFVAKRKAN